jgi:hypothetical protein
MKRAIVAIVCAAHMVHICMHSGCDTPPTDVEALVMYIYTNTFRYIYYYPFNRP